MKLNNKVAVLTGAANGIGLAVSRRYLAEGALCVLTDLQLSDELAALLASHPERTLWLQADITRTSDIQQLVQQAVARFGRIDILYNNAAIFDMAPLLEAGLDSYQRLFDVNVKGMFFL
ncbi:MAG: SDR family NAD(P)-dependent oxidoreductase, partial [Vogesella sp.]|uniref:SDR family NAD(P)-dependent oxidoreductase n=1 Tax=Vogesella sp. TaxID=1904252 RepID=UPI003F3C8A5F